MTKDAKAWRTHCAPSRWTSRNSTSGRSRNCRRPDIPPSEIEEWVDEGRKGLENALRAKPLDVKEQYERQIKELQEAYGEAMLELRARKKLQSLLGEDEK
ncbi:DUF1153 domain-containing protein [Noviherbaspirillum album]|uniref:DUF1153 domain-containing protein n=1 Tax=Noviherbaspirillum album TaxID=3080276 RepID=UPI003F58B85D